MVVGMSAAVALVFMYTTQTTVCAMLTVTPVGRLSCQRAVSCRAPELRQRSTDIFAVQISAGGYADTQPPLGRRKQGKKAPRVAESHLTPGPIVLSWAAAAMTMAAQAVLSSHAQLAQDAASLCSALGIQLEPAAQLGAMYVALWATGIGYSFVLMQKASPFATTSTCILRPPTRRRAPAHAPRARGDRPFRRSPRRTRWGAGLPRRCRTGAQA